jgi:tRNA (mo5U34)-methyltransferase
MSTQTTVPGNLTKEHILENVKNLGRWFHNINLNGVQTAPDHFLGDYPRIKFKNFENDIPHDLTGKTVLDIGCNAGFYSIEMKRRGAAKVVGIDSDDRYLAQARYAALVLGQEIDFMNLSVFDVASFGEKFDIVIFMGVLYHLRHPLLALDLLYEHVVGDILVFQSMQRGSETVFPIKNDYDFWEADIFKNYDFPVTYFIENRYSNDPTNWWIPNRSCIEAMLRSSGFNIVAHPETEVYICRRGEIKDSQARAVYPQKIQQRKI